jgi:transposase InsO family protein
MGHAAPTLERSALREYYFDLKEDELMQRLRRCKEICLNCDKYPMFSRRPLHATIHAKRPNEVLHSDFLNLGDGRYVLTLVDDFSRKTLLLAAERPASDYFLRIITMWKAMNGTTENVTICTDQGSHYCNQFVQAFKLVFPFVHKLSVKYDPWSNGSAENINKEVVKCFQMLMSQYLLGPDAWEEPIPLILYYINTKPIPSLNNMRPLDILVEETSIPIHYSIPKQLLNQH